MQPGAKAISNGKDKEYSVSECLTNLGIDFVKQHPFTSIYGSKRARMGFYIPSLDIAIVVKSQEVSGSCDHKLPYAMLNLGAHPAKRKVLVMAGHHYTTRRPTVYQWAKTFAATLEKKLDVLYIDELEDYLEQTEARQAA